MKRLLSPFLILASLWIALALVLPAGPALAQEAGGEDALVLDAPPFVLCERDDECEPIIGICGMWVGVNTSFRQEAIEILTELNNYRTCQPVQLKKPEKLGCNQGQCDIRPDGKGCMLYRSDGGCEVKCMEQNADGFCAKGCMIGVDCP